MQLLGQDPESVPRTQLSGGNCPSDAALVPKKCPSDAASSPGLVVKMGVKNEGPKIAFWGYMYENAIIFLPSAVFLLHN